MNITALAVDDEPLALDVIRAHCSRVPFIDLQRAFTEPTEALKYLKRFPVDLLFLDVHMPALSGIELYKAVPQKTAVIFTTAHSQYAVEGFNLAALDYLLKPIPFDRFLQAAERARDYIGASRGGAAPDDAHIYIRADYSLQKVAVADIVYIEGLDNYLKIHLRAEKPIVARLAMKSMAEKLAQHRFIRVHRSYIVPIADIDKVRARTLTLKNGPELPIGAAYAEEVERKWAVGE